MKKKSLLMTLLFIPLTMGCSNNNNDSKYDPFMIGDNLEVISSTEARLIANEAYNNLSYTSSLTKSSNLNSDNTKFYTGAFSSYADNSKTSTESNVTYFENRIDMTRSVTTTIYVGNDSTIENKNTSTTEWYGIKPVKEGETPSENYSLLRMTVDKYNGVSSTRYSSEDEFSSQENIKAIWNRYLVNSISHDYLTTSIAYSDAFTYVRDSQHVVGYYLSTSVNTEDSKIAPGKEDNAYVKKVEEISVIDFYKDEILGIGWTVRTVSSRVITSYLTTVDGQETEPIEISRQEDVTSLYYESQHESSQELPTYELDNSIPFAIAKYAISDDELVYDSKIDLENNDDYYRHFEDNFTGHAYYKEQRLEVGFYSFFDGTPETPSEYEKWGYGDIIDNKCVNYVVDPKSPTLPQEIRDLATGHKVFYVAEEAVFAFRVVFNEDMTIASEFSVAIIGR